jgi:hypothetical protein
VDIRTQKTLDEMTDSAVLAMALDDMEFLGLIKWKPDDDKKPAIGERQVSSGLALAEHDLRASPVKLRSIEDQLRQLLADNGFLVAPT